MKKLLFFSLMTISLSATAGAEHDFTHEESRQIRKACAVAKGVEVEVHNKYGDVVFEIGRTDSVIMEVSIVAYSERYEKVEQMMSMVDVAFHGGPDYVDIRTEWNSNVGAIKKSLTDISRLLGSNSRIEINYLVTVPVHAEIEVTNKFGDIKVPSLREDLRVELAHGDFWGRKVKSLKKLTASYSKVNIKEVERGDIDLKFSDLSIDVAGRLQLIQSSGDSELEEVDDLDVTIKHGGLDVESVRNVRLAATMAEVQIEELTGELTGSVKYGHLMLEEVKTQFHGIKLVSTMASVDIEFSSEIAFTYEITSSAGKGLSLPSSHNNIASRNTIDKQETISGTVATIPVGGKPASVVIDAKHTSISINLMN